MLDAFTGGAFGKARPGSPVGALSLKLHDLELQRTTSSVERRVQVKKNESNVTVKP